MADATKTSESSNNENAISEKLTELFESVLKSNNKLGAGAKTYAENIKNFLENARALHKQFEEAPSKKAKYQRVKACSDLVKTHHGEYVEAPLQMAYVVEKVLEQGSQGKRRSNEPFWLKTFVYNTETGKAGQCMPQAIYDEAVRWQKNPKVQKETFEGIANVFETLINFRDTLKEETRILKALYQPSGSAANTYTDKDGTVVEKEHVGEGSRLSDGNKIKDMVSIDQCGSAHTAEQCYLHRNEKNEQACLYMPHLRHLNPDLSDAEGKKAWEDMQKSVCVDRRAVPFRLERKANEMDQLAVRGKMQYDKNKTDPAYKMKGPSDEAKHKYTDIKSGKEYGNMALKLFNTDYSMYEADSDLTRNGNIVPVFFDVDGSSTFQSNKYNPKWFSKSTFGERQKAAAETIQRAARRTGVTKSSGMSAADKQGIPTKIQAKIDVLNNANSKYKESLKRFFKEGPENSTIQTNKKNKEQRLAAWRAIANKTDSTGRYMWENKLMELLDDPTDKEALEDFESSLKGLPFVPSDEIAARTVYEMAKAGTLGNGADDEVIRQLLLFDQQDYERPLLITAKGSETCNETLKALHLDFAQHKDKVRKPIFDVDEERAKIYADETKQNYNEGPVYNLSGKELHQFFGGEDDGGKRTFKTENENNYMKKYNRDTESWKEYFRTTSEEEMLNDLGPVRVIDLPADKKKNMFVMLTAGGDFDHYDDYGNYVGPVSAGGRRTDNKKNMGQKQTQDVVKGSKHLDDAFDLTKADNNDIVSATNSGCLFRMGTFAIMLLKGAAAGGHFTKVQQALKRIYDQMAEGAKVDDGTTEKKTALSITADEETFLEMMIFPEEANKEKNYKQWIDGKGRNAKELRKGVLETLYDYDAHKAIGIWPLDDTPLTADEKKINTKVRTQLQIGRDAAFTELSDNKGDCDKDQGDNCTNDAFNDFVTNQYPTGLLNEETSIIKIMSFVSDLDDLYADMEAKGRIEDDDLEFAAFDALWRWWNPKASQESDAQAAQQALKKFRDEMAVLRRTLREKEKEWKEEAEKALREKKAAEKLLKRDKFDTEELYNEAVKKAKQEISYWRYYVIGSLRLETGTEVVKSQAQIVSAKQQQILTDINTARKALQKRMKKFETDFKTYFEKIPNVKPLFQAKYQLNKQLKKVSTENNNLAIPVDKKTRAKLAILELLFWGDVRYTLITKTKPDPDDEGNNIQENGTDQQFPHRLIVDLNTAQVFQDPTKNQILMDDYKTKYTAQFITAGKNMDALRLFGFNDIGNLRTTIEELRAGKITDGNKDKIKSLAQAVNLIRQSKFNLSSGKFQAFAETWRNGPGTVKGISTSPGKRGV